MSSRSFAMNVIYLPLLHGTHPSMPGELRRRTRLAATCGNAVRRSWRRGTVQRRCCAAGVARVSAWQLAALNTSGAPASA